MSAPLAGGALRRWLRTPRRPLLRWGGWFFFAIGLLLAANGLRYLAHYPWPRDGLAQLFTVSAFVSHFLLLGAAPWLLLVLPLTLLAPRRQTVLPVGVALGAGTLTLGLVDSLLFEADQFHLDPLTAEILGWRTWGFAVFYLAVLLVFCSLLGRWIWSRVRRPPRRRTGLAVAAAAVALTLLTYGLHIWADAAYYVPITSFGRYLPLFPHPTAKRLLVRFGLIDLRQSRERELMESLGEERPSVLRYPLRPLLCDPRPDPQNILLIGVDGTRADLVTPEVAPNIAAFAQRSIRFARHYSGGNSSRTGLFSIFYGIPCTYWRSFRAVQRAPVLLDQLRAQDYQIGVFSSAALHHPIDLDRTAFAGLPNLVLTRTAPSGKVYDTDRGIADSWIDWVAGRDPARPFFGFLFFDSTPETYPPDYAPAFEAPPGAPPERERFARYQTSVRFADSLVGRVLDDLEARGLLEHTVVIVTSDHGEEFDDRGLGFKGHSTAYDEAQLHVPMIVHWPGRAPAEITHRTSHLDLAPTLLREVLGCRNDPEDYASGRGLFSGESWPWLVVGGYAGFGVVEPDQITISYPSGTFEIRDWDYQLIEHPEIHRDVVSDALRETMRFYAR
jgi:membrane-anchored protein YejM (alkaline phosphatase superfamily)